MVISGLKKYLLLVAVFAGSTLPAFAKSEGWIMGFWVWEFFGRLHPMVVHFPIAVLLLAAVLEFVSRKNFDSPLRQGINILIFTGAGFAFISAAFGWLLFSQGDYSGNSLEFHRWSGFVTAGLSGVTALLLRSLLKNQTNTSLKLYRASLYTTAVVISVAGHFGAMLTHGDDYLISVLPGGDGYSPGSQFRLASVKEDEKLSSEQQALLNAEVRGIFAHHCYQCHSSKKVKGDLRLDNKDMVFKGGEDGPIFISGNPDKSELIRRITLPRSDKDVMPPKGKSLQKQEIDLLRFWIESGAPWPDTVATFRVAKLEPRLPNLPASKNGLTNPVDLLVDDYFTKNEIKWSNVVDDRIFLRRIFLDIVGILPSPEEYKNFFADQRIDKRNLWVRDLLNRNVDYAVHWLTFWNDALRNDYTGTGYITNGRYNISNWLYQSLVTNKPYNQFVQELISPNKESKGFIEGIKWRGVVNASQATEMQAAQNVSQVFLGLNLKCASCHNSFISNWKLDEAYAFANIFADSTLEINRCDKPTGKKASTRILWKQLGDIDSTAGRPQRLKQLAEYLTKPANGRIYRTLVNRVWAQLMGRGLVEPTDAMDNEPWSQDLLDWLAVNFVENQKYDIKELIYLIATSKTYQLQSVGVKDANVLIANNYKFTGRVRKRISAEQFSDAVSTVIAPMFPDSLLSYKPDNKTKMELLSHQYVRASLVANNGFLAALGRPNRETVLTGRESQANLLQALELTNGDRFNQTVSRGAALWKQKYPDNNTIVNELFLKSLGRAPNDKELKAATLSLSQTNDNSAIEDLFWSVMLLPEFQIVY